METVNWLLAVGFFILLIISAVGSMEIMALLDKKDELMKDKILLSEENKMLVKENERLHNHIFILEEVELKKAPLKIKVQKEQKKADCSSH